MPESKIVTGRRPIRTAALALSFACSALALPAPAAAQREVVQALPNPATEELNEALRRLSSNPESLPALVQAGRASLELGDLSAAAGFFDRAARVAPEDGRVLAGRAVLSLKQGDPVRALRLFGEAESAGVSMSNYASERGLAFDLVGDNARAQEFYAQSLAEEENAVVLRRLALSQAIAGDPAASEATLLPLLQRQDLAAYRTRAFALAIGGRSDEAVSIAETMLPARLARRLAPYLRYMERLTPAQQAAAANLGAFPRASDIGRDRPDIAAWGGTPRRESAPRSADSRLIPGGEPLAPPQGSRESATGEEPQPASFAEAETSGELPPVSQSSAPAEEPVQAAVRDSRQGPRDEARPSLSVTSPEEASLEEAFADLEEEGAGPLAAPQGAVDITSIAVRREVPEPEEAAPPQHPSRYWVQVATGRDTSAFRWDWRRISREADGLLDDYEPFHTRWGASNRLVTGPFEDADAAQEMVTSLSQKGLDTFPFESAEGEEMRPVRR